MNKYTSLSLSKKLKKGGCELECEHWWRVRELDCRGNKARGRHIQTFITKGEKRVTNLQHQCYPAYDLLWDVCIKYSGHFFGRDGISEHIQADKHMERILTLLHQHREQRAEDYIWEHCVFNDKEK